MNRRDGDALNSSSPSSSPDATAPAALDAVPVAVPDGDGAAEAPLIVTTETRANRRLMIGLCLSLGLLSAFGELGLLFDPASNPPHPAVWFLIPIMSGCILLLIVAGSYPQRGTWVLDAMGATYIPLKGKPRFLAWEDVERVGLGRFVVLDGGEKGTIPFYRDHLARRDYRRLMEGLERRLGRDFDLTVHDTGPVLSIGAGRFRYVVWGIRVVFLAVLGCGYAWGLYWLASPLPDFWTALVVAIGMQVPIAVVVLRTAPKLKRLNPPWRVRIKH